MNNNMFFINSPLDQFEIRDLVFYYLPILADLHLSLTNISLYLIIAFTIFLIINFFPSILNKLGVKLMNLRMTLMSINWGSFAVKFVIFNIIIIIISYKLIITKVFIDKHTDSYMFLYLILGFLLGVLRTYLVFIIEKKNLKNKSESKNFLECFFNFSKTYLIISLVSMLLLYICHFICENQELLGIIQNVGLLNVIYTTFNLNDNGFFSMDNKGNHSGDDNNGESSNRKGKRKAEYSDTEEYSNKKGKNKADDSDIVESEDKPESSSSEDIEITEEKARKNRKRYHYKKFKSESSEQGPSNWYNSDKEDDSGDDISSYGSIETQSSIPDTPARIRRDVIPVKTVDPSGESYEDPRFQTIWNDMYSEKYRQFRSDGYTKNDSVCLARYEADKGAKYIKEEYDNQPISSDEGVDLSDVNDSSSPQQDSEEDEGYES